MNYMLSSNIYVCMCICVYDIEFINSFNLKNGQIKFMTQIYMLSNLLMIDSGHGVQKKKERRTVETIPLPAY